MSGLPHATALSKRGLTIGAWLLVLFCACLRFTMDTASVGRADSDAVIGMSAILTGILIALVHWSPSEARREARHQGLAAAVSVALASMTVAAGVPWLVFMNRSSDAPPGAVVAFWTTAFVGAVLVAAASLNRSGARTRVPAALILLSAGAGVLANWERPSSFSLLVRYTGPQIAMLTAGLVWVVLILLLAGRVRDIGWPAMVIPVSVGSLMGGAVVFALNPAASSSATSPIVLLAAGAFAVLHLIVLSLGPGRGAIVSGTAIAAAPAAITLLAILEAAVGMLGPRPLLIAPVAAASALGAASIWLLLDERESPRVAPSHPALILLAMGGLVLATVGMAAPALGVAVKGGLSDGQAFAVEFSMAGYETVAGWIAVSAVLLTVAAVIDRTGYGRLLLVAATSVVALIAWVFLRPMPLHTWVSWIPPEVQQDYGTEFASIVFSPLGSIWQPVGLIIAVLTAVGAAILARRAAVPAGSAESPTEKDQT